MNSLDEDIVNLDDNIINKFKEVFSTNKFNIQIDNNNITILSKDNDVEKRCIELTFHSDYIYIDGLRKCCNKKII
jgi:hypothetical protein